MSYREPITPLFVPADRPDRFSKAVTCGADAVIVDLEDGVSPDRKDIARDALPKALGLGVPVFVRINPIFSQWYEADVAALRQLPFENIMLPKAESDAEIESLQSDIGQRNVVPLIETAKGLSEVASIARTPGVRQFAFGPADYALDLGITPNPDAFSFALASLAVVSRAAGLFRPLDGPSFDIEAGELLRAEIGRARRLGAGGKLCIHPRQVAAVRRGFGPSREEILWAREVIAAAQGEGAQSVAGKMVDRPILERARLVLRQDALSNEGRSS
ncbi:MAG: citrate lyase subunit beta/citryl-CoA lyase [Afipia broomeae]|jgi:citrate lyase subunit beta/citryl-CoA lyase|nr:MAG: CoA ester lyase [Bradyrhizobiaceae bacterium]